MANESIPKGLTIAAEFVKQGVLSVDDDGRVWRQKQKVGGDKGPRWVDIPPVRADKELPSGRTQVQVYRDGVRYTCSAYRLAWYLAHGPIPSGYHIHHKDGNATNNRLDNLELVLGADHIAAHNKGRSSPLKGVSRGHTEGYKRSVEARRRNTQMRNKRTYEDFVNGCSATELSRREEVSTRQIYSRLQSFATNSDF